MSRALRVKGNLNFVKLSTGENRSLLFSNWYYECYLTLFNTIDLCKSRYEGQRYYNKMHCLLFDACGYIFVYKYLCILYEVTMEQFVDNKARFVH